MAKRKVSNLLALAVLSLLTERPMHPYEMSSVMRERGVSEVIKLNQSSLYAVIEALLREEWITAIEVQREGRYPERTVYGATDAGQAELMDWLRSLLRQPATEYTQFAAGLAFVGHLAPQEVMELLQEHARYLQEQYSYVGSGTEKAHAFKVDRVFLIENLYTLAMLEAKIAFIKQLIQEIYDGTLTEIKDTHMVWKIEHPELSILGSDEQVKPQQIDTPTDQA